MTSLSPIARLRARIRDERPSMKAMSLSISSSEVSRAICEITDGHLIVSVQGGSSVRSIDLDLSSNSFGTIGDLHQQLSRLPGYVVQLDEDAVLSFPSIYLASIPPTDIHANASSAELKHHVFSDQELDAILREAAQRHNPSYSLTNMPETEQVFVMQLAHAEVCRRQAYDSSKRRNLSETVNDLLSIAVSLEQTYASDVKRLARAIASPKEAQPNTMHEGDVVLGKMSRANLRTGRRSPSSSNLPPSQPILLDPTDVRDVEDDNIKVRWQKMHDEDLLVRELWVDMVPDVQRDHGCEVFVGTRFAPRPSSPSGPYSEAQRVTSSKLAYASYGTRWHTTFHFRTFEGIDNECSYYQVGDLESDTEYYFRLYVFDTNGVSSQSEVVRYKTKPLRARFLSTNWISATSAAAGSMVSVALDPSKGVLTADHVIKIGGKTATFTVVSPYAALVTVPNFENKAFRKDVTLASPTGLVDVKLDALKVV